MSHQNRGGADCRAAIEQLPHLAEKMCALWNSRDLDTFVHSILMDTREGKRQGLPVEVAKEMMFVAKLNNLVRAMDTAARLHMSVSEASQMIREGDRIARGLPALSDDPWAENVLVGDGLNIDMSGLESATVQPVRKKPAPAPIQDGPIQFEAPPAADTAKASTKHYLSIFLNEAPPIPPLVHINLTAQETARTARFPSEAPPPMSWEFFRCIAREIRSLGVDEVAMSHQGSAAQCPWIGDAIRFAKQHCRFPQAHLRVDLLNASDQQLEEAMAASLDCLVIELNMACGSWRTRAEEQSARDPNHLALRLSHLLQKREEIYSRTLHRCVIKVAQKGKTIHDHKLAPLVSKLAEMADAFSIEWLPDLHDLMTKESAENGNPSGGCLCWSPFIEANVRSNGHLVVCAHDSLESSYVADLKGTEFAEAWHAPAFQETRRGLLDGRIKGTLCSACPRMPR